MECEVIGASKGPLAVLALEGLDSSVLAHVARELVGAGELPAATLPVTFIRFLASVCPLVRLQVGALGVDFVAARVRATVNALVSLRGLGIVVDGIHEVVRGVGRERLGQQLRIEGLILQRGGWVGVRWSDDIGRGGIMLEG